MTTTLDHSPANTRPYGPYTAYLDDIALADIDPDPANERPGLAAAVAAALTEWPTLDPNDRILRLRDLGLDDLVSSLQTGGLLERVKVYPHPTGRYVLSSGHRRFFGAQFLGWATIPAIVEPAPAGAADADLARITANLCRRDLDPISLARGIQALLAGHPELTQAQVGAMLGKSQGAVANTLRLLDLPDAVLQLIVDGKLTAGHGLELLRITQPERQWYSGELTGKSATDVQTRYAQAVAANGTSVANLRIQVESYIRDEAQAVQQGRLRQAEAARARTAKLEQGGTLPADLSPEEIAAAQAERERKEAEAAKQQAAKGRQETRLAARERVADGVIDAALGWHPDAIPGATINLEVLRVAAVAALEGACQSTYSYLSPIPREERAALLEEIADAGDLPALLDLLARIGRRALALDSEKRALGGNWEISKWVDVRWGLSVRIANALRDAKLIQANSYATLVNGKPQPPLEPGT